MSAAEDKYGPGLLSPRNSDGVSPGKLKVTGTKLELVPAHRIPGTPLSAPPQDYSIPLPLNIYEDQSPERPHAKLTAGKGWKVTVSAVRELPGIRGPLQDLSLPQIPQVVVSNRPSFGKKKCKLVRSGVGGRKDGLKTRKDLSREVHSQGRDQSREGDQTRKVHRQGTSHTHMQKNSKGSVSAGGRHTKELKRSGYLERKYGLLWSHKVFGHMLPGQARQHHRTTLKKKVLVAWQELWWVHRKEWKLSIRAECHNRYRCWIMVWKAWSRYVSTCQEKKRKRLRSERLFSRLLLRRAWQGWQLYLQRAREKKKRAEFCRAWHVEWVQRRYWLQWRCALSMRVQDQALDLIALHHWASTVEGQAFAQWKRAYRAQRTAVNHLSHIDKKLKQSVMQAWWTYILIRRNKLHLQRVAVGSHNSGLLSKCFSHWRARLARSKELSQFQGLISHKGIQAVCRRALVKWKFFVALRGHKAELVDLAAQHHARALKAKALQAFISHVMLQRKVKLYNQQARAFHDRCRLQQCWGVWLQRCESNEEIVLGPLTRKARLHAARKLSYKVLAGWVQFVIQQRHKNSLKRAADTHFKETALPKCLWGFRENVLICRYKRQLRESSDGFKRETLLSMGFYKWWGKAQLTRDLRMLERVAILHWEEVAKRHWFHNWRNCYRRRNVHYEQEEMAENHRVESLLRGAFKKWVDRAKLRSSTSRQLQLALRHDAMKLEGKVWSAWRMHVVRQRGMHARREEADSHYKECILRKMLASWKCYHKEAVVETCKERAATQLHRAWLLRLAVSHWREEVRERRYGRQLHHTAAQHHAQRTLLKHLRGWRMVAAGSKEEREREDGVVLKARAHLLQVRAGRVLDAWRDHTVSMERERQELARAQHHHEHHVKHKLLSAWQAYHLTRHRKALLSTLSQQFSDTRLLCGCYTVWKQELMRALESKQKGVVSLWHWSHLLEYKVLQAWLAHTRERRRKEERYACAMDRHRQRLLGEGVRQWIRVATYRKTQREQQALNLQAKTTERVFGCVRRCADHWRALTRRHRPPQPLVPTQPPSPIPSSLQKSAKFWTSLAKQLDLPDGTCVRPQPRRPAPSSTSFSESLPRLLPPPSPQIPGFVEVGGVRLVAAGSLDVTADPSSTDPTLSQTSLVTPREPLPLSHPLMDRSVREEILGMRQRLRDYLQLKVQQKALLDQLAHSRLEKEEMLQLQKQLSELEKVMVDTQPVVMEVATKIDKLLELCS